MISGNRRPWAHLSTVGLVLVLVAGCGGGSSDSDEPAKAETTTPAPPKNYSLKQLVAAMPKVADVPGAGEIDLTCPADGDDCEMFEKDSAAVNGTIEAASPVGAEQVENQATPLDFFAVNAQRHADASGAKEVATVGDTDKQYVGTFDITQEDDGTKTRGKGAIDDDLTIGPWSGIIVHHTEISSDSKTDKGLLVASVRVSIGRTSVTSFVSVSAAGRDPKAAIELGESLVRDYLERLG